MLKKCSELYSKLSISVGKINDSKVINAYLIILIMTAM